MLKIYSGLLTVFLPIIGFFMLISYPAVPIEIQIMILVIFNILCPAAGFFLFNARIPKAAEKLWTAKRKRMIPMLIVHDTGRSVLGLIKERRGEGIVKTDEGTYKLLPRFVGMPGTGITNPGKDISKKEKQEYIAKLKRDADYKDWIISRSYLVGLESPFFLGYSGSLCLLNPLALALVEAGEMHIQTAEGWYPKIPDDKPISKIVQPLMLIDPRKTKAVLNKAYDETQIAAVIADVRMLGGFDFSGILKWILVILVIAGAIGGIIMFPQILRGLGVQPG